MFDWPIAVFTVDLGIFLACLAYHYSTNPQAKRNFQSYALMAGVAALIQADFAFLGAPTRAARAFHAPLFLNQVLAIAWGVGFFDKKSRQTAGQTRVVDKGEELKFK